MLDPRAQTLLKTLIERYIAEGQPVGSRTLSKFSGLELSPATIRNVMSDLEELGLVISPHTSAGRVPTPRGYRLFVDTMLTTQSLSDDAAVKLNIAERFQSSQPAKVVAAAASVLSSLSQFAGVVLTPRRSQSFKQIEFMRLSDRRILLIIVTPEGDIQNRIMATQREYTASQLIEASNFINFNYAGLTFDEVRRRLRNEIDAVRADMTGLMQEAVEASSEEASDDGDNLLISGERNLLEITDLSSSMERMRKLFDLFDQKTGLLQLLDVSSHAQGVQIFIGGESHLVPIEEMSVVTAPYEVDGKIVGTLGVIGPTRMAYQRVIPIVDITAKLLSHALSQH